MFEKRLKEISKEIGEESRNKFYILTHKKHRREIYFQNKKEAINFIKNKFNNKGKSIFHSFFYSFIYNLIKLGIIPHFLKKIKISSKFGNVIFVANQIKSFDLESKYAYSFIKNEKNKDSFIKSKKFQKELAKKGFAPEILEINTKIPLSKEELLRNYEKGKDKEIFKKLILYYDLSNVEDIPLSNYLNYLDEEIDKKNNNFFLKKVLFILKEKYSKNIPIKFVKAHGSFTKEQILIKNKKIIFTDWENEKRLITTDLTTFFRKKKKLLKNKKFKDILKIYPKDVQVNIKLYLLLSEIDALLRRERSLKISKHRIEEILGKI